MPQIPFRAASAIALVALTVFAAAHVSADEGLVVVPADDTRVSVRIYDLSAGAPLMRAAAIPTAAAIVSDAGIGVDWYDCSTNSSRLVCQNTRRTRNLIVRIMPTAVRQATATSISVEARTRSMDAELQLGIAAIDPTTGTGVMATVYHDRILMVARRSGVTPSELLGRVLAHEIGHLLLGTVGHGGDGLMRAIWTDAELAMNRREDWLFADAERRRLRVRLSGPEDIRHARSPSE